MPVSKAGQPAVSKATTCSTMSPNFFTEAPYFTTYLAVAATPASTLSVAVVPIFLI
jgi:hypothetical protein